MYTVYTTTQAIHNVPKDGLDDIGPETLKSITGISEEIPWDEKKLKAFKAKREKQIEMEKVEFESRVLDESVASWGEDNPNYFVMGVEYGNCYFVASYLAAQLNSLRDVNVRFVTEKFGARTKDWSKSKVNVLNAELKRRGDEEKREAKKTELASKIAELQKQLKELK